VIISAVRELFFSGKNVPRNRKSQAIVKRTVKPPSKSQCKNALQKRTAKTHCKNALQKRTAKTHCKNALQKRTAKTHCKNAQENRTDAPYKP
jgi:DNA-binding CsgD family transcriptional regulator